MSASPSTQVSDVCGLLSNSGSNPTSDQTAALLTLATLDFDIPPPDALALAQDLINSIQDQLTAYSEPPQSGILADQGPPNGDTTCMEALVANYGQQASLILARNRVVGIVTQAQDISQQ
jgi:hypothetical protein